MNEHEFERALRMLEDAMDRPRLIDIGRGTVDARFIVAVNTYDPEDFMVVEGTKYAIPAYAKSEVMLRGMLIRTGLDAATIVARWRQALDVPAPIGSEPQP